MMFRVGNTERRTVTESRGVPAWARARRLFAAAMAAALIASLTVPATAGFAADQSISTVTDTWPFLEGPLDGVGDSPLVP